MTGCMRMRKLGSDHSVLFFASQEIWRKIQKAIGSHANVGLDSSDVLVWTMRETCAQIKDNSALWASQGLNFDRRYIAWEDYNEQGWSTNRLAEVLQEQEARTLEELYGVRDQYACHWAWSAELSQRGWAIRKRCQMFGIFSLKESALLEEQERELAHEKEDERQVEKLLDAQPLDHHTDQALVSFIKSGTTSDSFISLRECLKNTSALPPMGIFRSTHLRATKDFYNTISLPNRSSGEMNGFLRVVQWILSNHQSAEYILISPFEANELLPRIRKSKSAFLHLYSPRVSRNTRSFEDLQFFAVPRPRSSSLLHSPTIHELNLFAGQLFLLDWESFEGLCGMLGLHLKLIPDEYKRMVDAGGFVKGREARVALGIRDCAISASPVSFLVELIGWRRKGQGFTLTHLGQILRGNNLDDSEFA
jgi:hypothetical protein